MDSSARTSKAQATTRVVLWCFSMPIVILALTATVVTATERGTSVYPSRPNGVTFGEGYCGRDSALGPQVRCHLGPTALILKYQKDTLVQNGPYGNAFWFEVGVPVGDPHAPPGGRP